MTTGVRRTIRDEQKELTREKLKSAAIACFIADGYPGTAVNDITAAAGATRATFYRHFKSKAELVLACLDELDKRYAPQFDELPEVLVGADPAVIRRWLENAVAIWSETRDISVIVNESAVVEREVQERRQSSFDAEVARIADRLVASGRWTPVQARTRAELTFHQLRLVFELWSRRDSSLDLDESVTVLTAMWSSTMGDAPNS